MQENRDGRVLIVGAGLGGLAAAIGLRNAGFRVDVFERGPNWEKIQVGGGMDMQMNAMRAFKKLGVHNQIQEQGTMLDQLVIVSTRGKLLGMWPYAQLAKEFGVHDVRLTRDVLHRVLAEAVPAENVHFSKEVSRFDQDEQGVTLQFADGTEERGAALVGADGVNSVIRRQLLGDTPLKYAGYAFFRGMYNAPHEKVPPGTARMVMGWGAWFNMYPLGNERVSWFSCFKAPEGQEVNKDEILSHHRGWLEPVEQLISATDPSSLSRINIVDRDPVEKWGEGRVTLLGDSAHVMAPTIAQGACQAMEDAVVLAESLAKNPNISEALRAYETRRIPRANGFVSRARKQGQMFVRDGALFNFVRDRYLMYGGHRKVRQQFVQDMTYEF